MEQPLISIVMVNYNYENFIGRAIESVLAQTWKNWELIIVDDGSTDASPEIINRYAAEDSRIKPYLQKENRHISAVTNLGLSKVTGSYIARLDSDDLWEPKKLEKQMRYMQEHPQGALCFTKLDIINENEEVINDSLTDLYQLYNNRCHDRNEWIRYFFFYGNTLIQSTLLMKREVVEHVGGFNLAYLQSHDFDFFVRASRAYEFIFVEEPLVKYRRTEKQNSSMDHLASRRFENEHMNIRYHYFDDMSDEFFIEVFQNCFINRDSKSHEELLCEQAFLLCKCICTQAENPVLGAKKLLDLIQDPQMLKVLEEKFRFTPKDFYKISDRPMFFDGRVLQECIKLQSEVEDCRNSIQLLEDQKQDLDRRLAESENQNQYLKEKIYQMEQTKVWRLRNFIKGEK